MAQRQQEDTKRSRTLRARITPEGGRTFDDLREKLHLTESDAVRAAVSAWVKRGGKP